MFDSFIKTEKSGKEIKTLDREAVSQWIKDEVDLQFFIGDHPYKITVWGALPEFTKDGKMKYNPRKHTSIFLKSGWDKCQTHLFTLKMFTLFAEKINEIQTKLNEYYDWLDQAFETVEDKDLSC